jgi:hypothetical protein
MRPTWDRAWGKLPRSLRERGSYSSASSPTSLPDGQHALEELASFVEAAVDGQVVGEPPVGGAADPRHQRAVVEADDQLHAHRDAPLPALDDAYHLGHAWRHAVHHGGDARLRLELGLEHERVAAVRASHAPVRRSRSHR